MQTKPVPFLCAVAALSWFASGAQAASFDFSGNIANHNDVVRIEFTLASDTLDVRLWTDSYRGGVNFDPTIAVFSRASGNLLEDNDDNPFVASTQTLRDGGITFDALAAGSYLLTVAAYPNGPVGPVGTSLASGFKLDGQAPIPIASYLQPDDKVVRGSFYSVHLSGVTTAAVSPVPEPASYALLLAGLAAVGAAAACRRARAC